MSSTPRQRTRPMIDAPTLMTANELFAYDAHGKRAELVEGRLLVREPVGLEHGRLTVEVSALLHAFANPPGKPSLGVVLAGDPGFVIERSPDTVRAPDIAFVRRERWPVQNQERFGDFAPDMAIEIRSPSDETGAVLTKVGQWLSAGVTLVWVIDPQQRIAQHFTADGSIILLGDNDVLDGAPVLTGLNISLSSLWQAR